jgi:hypothetical protein
MILPFNPPGMDEAEIKTRLITKMLRKRMVGKSKKKSTILAWFPSDSQEAIQKIIEDLINDPHAPLVTSQSPMVNSQTDESAQGIALHSYGSAIRYLQSLDTRIPAVIDQSDINSDHKSKSFSTSQFNDRIRELEEELQRMEETAEDWRFEAKRRQRISIIIGILSFTLGVIGTGLFPYVL